MSDFDPIGTIAFFRERLRAETITTAKVLRAMTPEMMDHRLHPKSSTIGEIAWTVVRCLWICNHLTHHSSAEVSRQPPPSLQELLSAFDGAARELSATLLTMSQSDWEAPRMVSAGSRNLLNQSLGQIFWLFHFDSIHHRGQISVFLRPFGVRVPAIYGPSGDFQP